MKSSTVLIIGTGFAGQGAAIQLQRNGIDCHLLERRGFLGGTWAQNVYPGAAVDVPSPLYSFSFELYPWTQMFAAQDELQAYTEHVLTRYRLRQKATLGATVIDARWDAARKRWTVTTKEGATFHGRYLINATGPLSKPVVPDFSGRNTFDGASFHTNNWDLHYDHSGKRIAVIGSGASAAQVVPELVKTAAELHVFQRTPHWVLPRPDHVFSPFERKLLKNRLAHKALRKSIYWRLETRVIGMKYADWLLRQLGEKHALHLLEQQVPDPELRARLTPSYRIGCKRILLSSTLYPALSNPKTTVYTNGRGIHAINKAGIVTEDGTQIGLDLIVYATGYDAIEGIVGYPIVGRDGRSVQSFWRDYPRAYLGTTLPGLPNFFIMLGPNTGIGHTSALHILESQLRYVVDCIVRTERAGLNTIEVRSDAEAAYTQMIHQQMERTVWHRGGCNSWYKHKSGRVIAMFPGFSFSYRRLTRRMNPAHHLQS